MKPLKSHEIRDMYLKFFEEKGHEVLESASLIPVEDPTLLWINSGVATLKKYFDGSVKPDNPRLTSSQKSIRTNDIENVGITARHHTLFEMLGNFSVGEYFKKEAIHWAWEFLTSPKWLAMDPDKLYVTVYPDDKEAHDIWINEIGLSPDRVIDEEGNFWDIGQGPCGPNTEIFFDRGPEYNNVAEDDPENYPGGENERWLEIWNLVFSQFNHLEDDTYEPLPNKNIDTGMGLERVASVMQNTPTNFETDLFMPMIKQLEAMTGIDYYENEEKQVSFKVIVDHIRTIVFAIADGALPSNEGRGYVLRRLLRRSVMHGHKLGIEKPFLTELVPTVGEIMGDFYPNVVSRADFIKKVIRQEEHRFHETLVDGQAHLEVVLQNLKESGQTEISGQDAFLLYDTYGFPIELTQEYADEHGYTVDIDGFKEQMKLQKERARNARTDEQSMGVQSDLYSELPTDSVFLGYKQTEATGELIALIADGEMQSQVSSGTAYVVFDQTPFFAESGGQVADTGDIFNADGKLVARVKNVKKAPARQNLHEIEVLDTIEVGQSYRLQVDVRKRRMTERNHTATHLLHQALKDVLGDHAMQAGSLVAPDYLRFDFHHFEAISDEDLKEVERIVNEKIWEAIPVETIETDIDTGRKMGAIALFGEKYEQQVRVVKISDYSMELCGGTHVKNTSEIGCFKLTSESGIGAGTRRIFALTSAGAVKYFDEQLAILDRVQDELKAQKTEDIPARLTALEAELTEVKRENESLNSRLASAQAGEIFDHVQEAGDYTLIAEKVEAKDMNQLRQMVDRWKEETPSNIVVLAAANGGKVSLIVAVDESSVASGVKAGDLIKSITAPIAGGGGGRPDMAQAGGSNPAGVTESLGLAKEWLSKK